MEKKQTAIIGSSSTDYKRKSPRSVLHEDDEEEEEMSSQKRTKTDDNKSAFETDQTIDETFVMRDLPANLERTVGVVVTPYLQLTTPYQRAFGCMQFRTERDISL